ncbi:MAG: TonB-dependent receptor [Flavobacteriales bacterium]|nr:TonB-dependent receptor [Flavobacteriales bacterium]
MSKKSSIKAIILLFSFISISNFALSQNVKVYGTITNALNNDPIPFANIVVEGTMIGTTSDIDGNYEILNLQAGAYNFKCSYIGFNTDIQSEIKVSSNKNLRLDFFLSENSEVLSEVKVKGNTFNKTKASPVSLRTINASEISKSPGGNRDISKVISNLPGVSSSSSFRNDIIIRGGAPSENRFFLDGIEIQTINHFSTQGSSGGPVGILNVNFIREVDLYTGAFPANRGNALSSVMELKQIEGNDEEISGSFTVGSSDAGLTLNTPISKKSTLLLSVRRSYLQFLFKALKLPFLPTYNDMQFKYTYKPNNKNQFNFLGIAAIDDFTLNPGINEGEKDSMQLAQNNYNLNNLVINNQWNYTVGGTWRHFFSNSNLFFVMSRSHLNNTALKYLDYADETSQKILDYKSEEIENKTRLEYNFERNEYTINVGANLEDATYLNNTKQNFTVGDSIFTGIVNADLNFLKYGAFTQIGKTYFSNKLAASFGLRIDGNSFTESKNTPNLSPRLSLAFNLSEKISLNSNIGRFYQLPTYTILGFEDDGKYLNKDASYISCDHLVIGIEYNPSSYSKITLESFYKSYANYPFSVLDSISLANLGGDFGVIGNEDISSISKGNSYGVELLAQQKMSSSIYGILSVTYYRSRFEDKKGDLVASTWDNRFILNMTAGKKFKRNIELGLKYRYSGGAPYTPIDLINSSNKAIWDINQRGVLDYNLLNTKRLNGQHGLDIRVDKKWFFKSWSLNAYIDIENILNAKRELPSEYGIDPNLGPLVAGTGETSDSYPLYEIINNSGTVLPSIGLLIEF